MGLVLVTGPTGSGKSTTLAALIKHISKTMPGHIITIEDPMEFLFTDGAATVSQRSPTASRTKARALRSVVSAAATLRCTSARSRNVTPESLR